MTVSISINWNAVSAYLNSYMLIELRIVRVISLNVGFRTQPCSASVTFS